MTNKINLFHKNEIGKTLEFSNLEPNKYNVKVSKLSNNGISVSNDGLYVDLSEVKSIIETLKAELDKEIGVAKAFPTQSIPEGYLPMEGQKFDTDHYPKLAKIYPSGILPDLRGEFLRGWDNGRGIDSGRDLLSSQGDDIKAHNHDIYTVAYSQNGSYEGQYSSFAKIGYAGWSLNGVDGVLLGNNRPSDSSIQSNTANAKNIVKPAGGNENRPRNIAFRFACRVG